MFYHLRLSANVPSYTFIPIYSSLSYKINSATQHRHLGFHIPTQNKFRWLMHRCHGWLDMHRSLECQIEGRGRLYINILFLFLTTWPKLIWPYPFYFLSWVIWQPVLSISPTGQLKPQTLWMLTILLVIYGYFVICFLYIWQSLFTYCMMKINLYWKLLLLQED